MQCAKERSFMLVEKIGIAATGSGVVIFDTRDSRD